MKLADLRLAPLAGRLFEFERSLRSGQKVKEKVLICLPTAAQVDEARVRAANYVHERDPLERMPRRDEFAELQETIEVLVFALRDPEKPDMLWAGRNEIRTKLTQREVNLLADAYVEWERECVRRLTPKFDHVAPPPAEYDDEPEWLEELVT